MTSHPEFSTTLRASWRVAFAALALSVAGLVLAVAEVLEPHGRATALRAASAAVAAGMLACMLILRRRVNRRWPKR
jgi:Na+/melibiose symporter-like transporter